MAQANRVFCLARAERVSPASRCCPLLARGRHRASAQMHRLWAKAAGASECMCGALSPGVHAHDGAQQLAALERLVPPLLLLPPRGGLLRDPAVLCQGECGLVESVPVEGTGEPEAPQHPGATPAAAQGFGASRPLSHPHQLRLRPERLRSSWFCPHLPRRGLPCPCDHRDALAGEEGRGCAHSQRPLAGPGLPAVLRHLIRLLQLHGQHLLQQR